MAWHPHQRNLRTQAFLRFSKAFSFSSVNFDLPNQVYNDQTWGKLSKDIDELGGSLK